MCHPEEETQKRHKKTKKNPHFDLWRLVAREMLRHCSFPVILLSSVWQRKMNEDPALGFNSSSKLCVEEIRIYSVL